MSTQLILSILLQSTNTAKTQHIYYHKFQLFERVLVTVVVVTQLLYYQSLSPLQLWVRTLFMARCTRCGKVCQWFATGWWFSRGTPVSSANKTHRQDITEILLKVVLNTINPPKNLYNTINYYFLFYTIEYFVLLYQVYCTRGKSVILSWHSGFLNQ